MVKPQAKSKVRRYCICRSADGTGSMVCCDKCEEWFHYKCLNIKAEDLGSLYFCDRCIKEAKPRCRRPECCIEKRADSDYCSDQCGLEFNKQRYHKFFLPKWEQLETNHSHARKARLDELEKLENEKMAVLGIISRLKQERGDLERTIKTIKDEARALGRGLNQNRELDKKDPDGEDEEENTTSDQSKVFCVMCGIEQPADKAFKHWTNCYKKIEGNYVNYIPVPHVYSCETDENPDIYCQKMVDKKKGWYCPNIGVVCPTHSNWHADLDDICGCPLTSSQQLLKDGNYCLKSKKNCTLHYHWDRFRLATKDYERAQAFQRLLKITEDISRTQNSLNDTYGGVIGVMLHNTIDHKKSNDNNDDDQEMVDIQSLSMSN